MNRKLASMLTAALIAVPVGGAWVVTTASASPLQHTDTSKDTGKDLSKDPSSPVADVNKGESPDVSSIGGREVKDTRPDPRSDTSTSHDSSKDVSKDSRPDPRSDTSTSHDSSKDSSKDSSRDANHDASHDASKDALHDGSPDRSTDASQGAAKDGGQ